MSPSSRRKSGLLNRTWQRRHKPDYSLVLLSVILLVFGLVVIYSIGPGLAAQQGVGENYYVTKQLMAIGLGLIAFVATSLIPLAVWRRFQKHLIIGALIAAAGVRLLGQKVNGAYRWIQIGGLSFQAVELAKFAVLIWLAVFLVDRYKRGLLGDFDKTFRPLLIMLGLVGVVVTIVQRDLGSTGVIVAMVAAMCYIVGMPLKKVAFIGGIVLIGIVLAVSSTGYRRDRLTTFLRPNSDCLNTGYQECQALISVGSGGLAGKGLARGVQAYGYQPYSANDSIFAIIAEKFGFIGVTVLLALFTTLFMKLKNIMERAPDLFSRLVMVGILAWLSTQMIMNIGAMIGLLPLKGITLPFISYGGTSIMFVAAIMGVAFNISRYTTYDINQAGEAEGTSDGNSSYRGRDRRTYYASLGNR